jgi:hypothetical protein
VRQHEVLLLQKVREKVAAHKAFMITNTGYTGRAMKVALDEGIALLILRPNFDTDCLNRTRRHLILQRIRELAKTIHPLYHYEVFHKAWGMLSQADWDGLNVREGSDRASADMDAESRRRAGIPLDLRELLPPPAHIAFGGGPETIKRGKRESGPG